MSDVDTYKLNNSQLECYGIGEVKEQSLALAAGKTGTVWYMKVGPFVGFLDELICSRSDDSKLGTGGTYMDWYIDGRKEDRIDREIPFATPKEFTPPIIVRDYVRFIAVNGDNTSHTFKVVLDGRLCRPRQAQGADNLSGIFPFEESSVPKA